MRVYKFRGKVTNSNEWLHGSLIDDGDGKLKIRITENYDVKGSWGTGKRNKSFISGEVVPESVGQWTGFNDSNGTDIYEGDLFETKKGAILHVVWDYDRYCLEPYDGIADCKAMRWAVKHVIIGNLFDEKRKGTI